MKHLLKIVFSLIRYRHVLWKGLRRAARQRAGDAHDADGSGLAIAVQSASGFDLVAFRGTLRITGSLIGRRSIDDQSGGWNLRSPPPPPCFTLRNGKQTPHWIPSLCQPIRARILFHRAILWPWFASFYSEERPPIPRRPSKSQTDLAFRTLALVCTADQSGSWDRRTLLIGPIDNAEPLHSVRRPFRALFSCLSASSFADVFDSDPGPRLVTGRRLITNQRAAIGGWTPFSVAVLIHLVSTSPDWSSNVWRK